jgi:hypothetical protein
VVYLPATPWYRPATDRGPQPGTGDELRARGVTNGALLRRREHRPLMMDSRVGARWSALDSAKGFAGVHHVYNCRPPYRPSGWLSRPPPPYPEAAMIFPNKQRPAELPRRAQCRADERAPTSMSKPACPYLDVIRLLKDNSCPQRTTFGQCDTESGGELGGHRAMLPHRAGISSSHYHATQAARVMDGGRSERCVCSRDCGASEVL